MDEIKKFNEREILEFVYEITEHLEKKAKAVEKTQEEYIQNRLSQLMESLSSQKNEEISEYFGVVG